MKKKIIYIFILLFLSLFVSCQDNVFFEAVPTEEAKRTVDALHDEITGLEETVLFEPIPVGRFIDDLAGILFGEDVSTEVTDTIKEIVGFFFVYEEGITEELFASKVEDFYAREKIPGVTLSLVKGFGDEDVFPSLRKIQTRADVKYMNEVLGATCEEGKFYTGVFYNYYDWFLSFLGGSSIKGVLNIGEEMRDDLSLADIVSFRIATRLIFKSIIEAVYDEYCHQAELGEDLYSYMEKVVANPAELLGVVNESLLDDILGSYSILNKMKDSTTIISIKMLEGTV